MQKHGFPGPVRRWLLQEEGTEPELDLHVPCTCLMCGGAGTTSSVRGSGPRARRGLGGCVWLGTVYRDNSFVVCARRIWDRIPSPALRPPAQVPVCGGPAHARVAQTRLPHPRPGLCRLSLSEICMPVWWPVRGHIGGSQAWGLLFLIHEKNFLSAWPDSVLTGSPSFYT